MPQTNHIAGHIQLLEAEVARLWSKREQLKVGSDKFRSELEQLKVEAIQAKSALKQISAVVEKLHKRRETRRLRRALEEKIEETRLQFLRCAPKQLTPEQAAEGRKNVTNIVELLNKAVAKEKKEALEQLIGNKHERDEEEEDVENRGKCMKWLSKVKGPGPATMTAAQELRGRGNDG
jgi:hypothetical protein